MAEGAGIDCVVRVTPALLGALRDHGIALTSDIDRFDAAQGWLAPGDTLRITRSFVIEGPSAFYGGPYGQDAWMPQGGLCAMGACSYAHSALPEGVSIGRYSSIARGLRFLDFAHPTEWVSSSVAFFRPEGRRSLSTIHHLCDRELRRAGIEAAREEFDPEGGRTYPAIGNDVWIGENVTLAMGITIGDGAVVAAGSIVTRDVEPYGMVAGVPAVVRRKRFVDETIERLQAVRWHRYSPDALHGLDIRQPDRFIDQLEARIAAGAVAPWSPGSIRFPDDVMTLEPRGA